MKVLIFDEEGKLKGDVDVAWFSWHHEDALDEYMKQIKKLIIRIAEHEE